MSLMNTFEDAVLNAMLGAGATLLGSPVEIGLSTTEPTEAGGNITEPTGFGYARASVTNDGTAWPAASSGVKSNAGVISFPQASGGNWGLITHWVLYSGGAPKLFGILDNGSGTAQPRQVNDGDTFRFLAGGLRITMD